MKIDDKSIEILSSRNQLNLFGYESYFNSFVKLYKKDELPNVILLNGPKGLGKATFAYHFINYILSEVEEKKYSVSNLEINPNNKSYKLVCKNMHPNFFYLESSIVGEDIKIGQVRDVLKFMAKTTYSRDLKIIMIDNAEYLNRYSSNALLKALEEPSNNTFFFIIHNSSFKILDTIKSRCVEFKFFLNTSQKRKILENVIKDYKKDFNIENMNESFFFDTPGNLLKCLIILKDSNINISKDNLSCISYLIEKFKNSKDSDLLILISLFVERFYNQQCLSNIKNLNNYLVNLSKILKYIDEMKKFNLDKKSSLILIQEILAHET